tara:strand:- start:1242 stop:1748 length:507 start_codon:yes stop_codon:yes gene_type:complete
MPTVDIRPEAIGSDSGFDQTGTNLLQRINDNDTNTFITNISSANFDVLIENSSAYSGATINNVTVAVIGNTINEKVSSASLVVELRDASSLLQSSTLNFTPTESTQTGAAYSTNLTPSIVDSFTLNGAVQTVGLIIKEVFIRVDYSASSGKIILPSGKIHLMKGKITL